MTSLRRRTLLRALRRTEGSCTAVPSMNTSISRTVCVGGQASAPDRAGVEARQRDVLAVQRHAELGDLERRAVGQRLPLAAAVRIWIAPSTSRNPASSLAVEHVVLHRTARVAEVSPRTPHRWQASAPYRDWSSPPRRRHATRRLARWPSIRSAARRARSHRLRRAGLAGSAFPASIGGCRPAGSTPPAWHRRRRTVRWRHPPSVRPSTGPSDGVARPSARVS